MIDQIKIGRFIADMRKKKGLSQRRLAEQIGVTDKTVSKWETGCRLPDATLLMDLSNALQIDVNELLAGEKFAEEYSTEEYTEKSENNIVNLVGELNEIDKKKKSREIGMVSGFLFICVTFSGLFVTSLPKGRIIDIFDLPTLFCLLGLKILTLSVSGWFYDYLNAWKLCVLRKELPEREIQASIQAIKYTSVLSLAIGCMISLISMFSLLNYADALSMNLIGPALAQIILALLYTAIAETFYVILLYRMKRMIFRR